MGRVPREANQEGLLSSGQWVGGRGTVPRAAGGGSLQASSPCLDLAWNEGLQTEPGLWRGRPGVRAPQSLSEHSLWAQLCLHPDLLSPTGTQGAVLGPGEQAVEPHAAHTRNTRARARSPEPATRSWDCHLNICANGALGVQSGHSLQTSWVSTALASGHKAPPSACSPPHLLPKSPS